MHEAQLIMSLTAGVSQRQEAVELDDEFVPQLCEAVGGISAGSHACLRRRTRANGAEPGRARRRATLCGVSFDAEAVHDRLNLAACVAAEERGGSEGNGDCDTLEKVRLRFWQTVRGDGMDAPLSVPLRRRVAAMVRTFMADEAVGHDKMLGKRTSRKASAGRSRTSRKASRAYHLLSSNELRAHTSSVRFDQATTDRSVLSRSFRVGTTRLAPSDSVDLVTPSFLPARRLPDPLPFVSLSIRPLSSTSLFRHTYSPSPPCSPRLSLPPPRSLTPVRPFELPRLELILTLNLLACSLGHPLLHEGRCSYARPPAIRLD